MVEAKPHLTTAAQHIGLTLRRGKEGTTNRGVSGQRERERERGDKERDDVKIEYIHNCVNY